MASIPYYESGGEQPPAELLTTIRSGRDLIPNLYRMLLWSPATTAGWVELANAVRFASSVSDRDRELAIVLASHLCRCEYEWHHHSRLALHAGVTEAQLDAVRRWPELDAYPWTSHDRALLGTVAAVVAAGGPLPSADLDLLLSELGERTVVELVATVSYYLAVAHFLTAFQIEMEPQ